MAVLEEFLHEPSKSLVAFRVAFDADALLPLAIHLYAPSVHAAESAGRFYRDVGAVGVGFEQRFVPYSAIPQFLGYECQGVFAVVCRCAFRDGYAFWCVGGRLERFAVWVEVDYRAEVVEEGQDLLVCGRCIEVFARGVGEAGIKHDC